MNYSFLGKFTGKDFIKDYNVEDFLFQNKNKLYNTYNSQSQIAQALPRQNSKDANRTNPNGVRQNEVMNKFQNNYTQNYNMASYEQNKNNWATENSIQKTMLKSIYTATPLGELYFSLENIDRLQKMIKYEIFIRNMVNINWKLTRMNLIC